jgi:hypothetical protein
MLRRAVRALSNARRSCFNATPPVFYFGTQPLAIALLGRWILTNLQRLRGVQSPELRGSGVSQTSPGARGGIMYAQRCVVVGIMLTTLGGCVALSDGPQRAYPIDEVVGVMRSFEQNETLPPALLAALKDTSTISRNNFITERMAAIDLEFNPYFARLTTQNQTGNLATDTALVTTTFLATVLASSATKTALAAAATGLASVRTDINQDVLLTHTIQLLLQQMETSRNHIRVRIEQNLQACTVTQYTVWQAMTDLEDYYRAGTLPGALDALAAATGNSNQQSKDQQNGQNQSGTPTPPTNSVPQAGTAVTCIANTAQALRMQLRANALKRP